MPTDRRLTLSALIQHGPYVCEEEVVFFQISRQYRDVVSANTAHYGRFLPVGVMCVPMLWQTLLPSLAG